jgi:hypothetical protein
LIALLGVSAAITTAYGDANSDEGATRKEWSVARGVLLDARLVALKAALALSADQEKNWSGFEAAVRDTAKTRRGEHKSHEDAEKNGDEEPSPIDRMRRISERLERRATALKTLSDAAAPLYGSLDDKQKLVFRALVHDYWLAHREHRRG